MTGDCYVFSGIVWTDRKTFDVLIKWKSCFQVWTGPMLSVSEMEETIGIANLVQVFKTKIGAGTLALSARFLIKNIQDVPTETNYLCHIFLIGSVPLAILSFVILFI